MKTHACSTAHTLADTPLHSFESRPPTNQILFEVPDFRKLCQSQTVVDLHFHTTCSDGMSTPHAVAQKAGELGIGVAITDHNAIDGALELAWHTDVLSIPGIEVTSHEGAHLLVYFYDIQGLKHFYRKDVRPFLGKDIMSSLSLPMEELIQRARLYDALVVFPHPFSAMYTGVCNPLFSEERQRALLEMADGVEAINAGNVKKWNLKCAVLGFNLGKAVTGGSDGHNLYQMGRAVTYAPVPKDRTAFLDAIRNQENRVIGREIDLIRKVAGNSVKLPSSLRNSPHLMGKNMRYSYAFLNDKSRKAKAQVQQAQRQIVTRLDNHRRAKDTRPKQTGLLAFLKNPFRKKRG